MTAQVGLLSHGSGLPARGYGLKKIARFVGLKYSAANAGGAQSRLQTSHANHHAANAETEESSPSSSRESPPSPASQWICV